MRHPYGIIVIRVLLLIVRFFNHYPGNKRQKGGGSKKDCCIYTQDRLVYQASFHYQILLLWDRERAIP